MADHLTAFSKTAKAVKVQEAANRAEGQRAKRRSPGEAPSGYDQEIWSLAIEFQRGARFDRIDLAADLPVIHDVFAGLVDTWSMREKTYPHYFEACERRLIPESQAAHCWYHPRADVRQRNLSWAEMVQVIMDEFWSRIWDEHALDWFRQYFAEYGRKAVRHWASLSAIEAINARPKVERDIMRRRTPGASMADASKEGE